MNQGYGAALRTGFHASRFPLVAFTDGDRQFRLVDLGRLLTRIEEPIAARKCQAPGRRRGVSHQARRSGHPPRLRPPLPARAADLLPAARPGCRLRLQALPPRGARARAAGIRRRVPLRRAADQGPGERGRVVEVGVPHYARVAGSASGANPKVVLRAVRDFWRLRVRLWANRPPRCGAVSRWSRNERRKRGSRSSRELSPARLVLRPASGSDRRPASRRPDPGPPRAS